VPSAVWCRWCAQRQLTLRCGLGDGQGDLLCPIWWRGLECNRLGYLVADAFNSVAAGLFAALFQYDCMLLLASGC
jgi:hypothetical protein